MAKEAMTYALAGALGGAALMWWWAKRSTFTLAGKLSEKEYVDLLGLIPHPEGGFFVETFRSGATPMESRGKTAESGDLMRAVQPKGIGGHDAGKPRVGGERNVLTSIVYCLTTESPRQWWANNMSDHIHYWHGGGSLAYHVVHPDGRYEKIVLGPRADRGERVQVVVRGGSFKCAMLEEGSFVMLGEAVAPGFDFRDFAFVTAPELKKIMPDRYGEFRSWLKEKPESEFDEYYDESKK
jgi:predicted cupin superfamily sugar epimerase